MFLVEFLILNTTSVYNIINNNNNIFKMELEYIYLLKVREFINSKQDIYKVGRTMQINHNRLKQYPKSSMLFLQKKCIDRHKMERVIIGEFKEKFIQRKDIGREYFEGNCDDMIDIIDKHIKCERKEHKKKNQEDKEENKEEDKEDDDEEEEEEEEDDDEDNPIHQCLRCEKVYISEIQLKNHNCVKYKCRLCGMTFERKSHYKDHKNRKFPCVATKKHIKNGLVCIKCNTGYSNPYNLNRHLSTCGKDVKFKIYIQKRTL